MFHYCSIFRGLNASIPDANGSVPVTCDDFMVLLIIVDHRYFFHQHFIPLHVHFKLWLLVQRVVGEFRLYLL